jgi:hypothetical protein
MGAARLLLINKHQASLAAVTHITDSSHGVPPKSTKDQSSSYAQTLPDLVTSSLAHGNASAFSHRSPKHSICR